MQIFPGICGDAEPSKRQARGLHVEIVDMLPSRSFHSFEGSRCEKHHAERRTFDGVWSFYWPGRNLFPQRKHSYIVMIDYLYESFEFGGEGLGAESTHRISDRIPV